MFYMYFVILSGIDNVFYRHYKSSPVTICTYDDLYGVWYKYIQYI